jgi:hypothetical protein
MVRVYKFKVWYLTGLNLPNFHRKINDLRKRHWADIVNLIGESAWFAGQDAHWRFLSGAKSPKTGAAPDGMEVKCN